MKARQIKKIKKRASWYVVFACDNVKKFGVSDISTGSGTIVLAYDRFTACLRYCKRKKTPFIPDWTKGETFKEFAHIGVRELGEGEEKTVYFL